LPAAPLLWPSCRATRACSSRVDEPHEDILEYGDGEEEQVDRERQAEAHFQLEPEPARGEGVPHDFVEV